MTLVASPTHDRPPEEVPEYDNTSVNSPTHISDPPISTTTHLNHPTDPRGCSEESVFEMGSPRSSGGATLAAIVSLAEGCIAALTAHGATADSTQRWVRCPTSLRTRVTQDLMRAAFAAPGVSPPEETQKGPHESSYPEEHHFFLIFVSRLRCDRMYGKSLGVVEVSRRIGRWVTSLKAFTLAVAGLVREVEGGSGEREEGLGGFEAPSVSSIWGFSQPIPATFLHAGPLTEGETPISLCSTHVVAEAMLHAVHLLVTDRRVIIRPLLNASNLPGLITTAQRTSSIDVLERNFADAVEFPVALILSMHIYDDNRGGTSDAGTPLVTGVAQPRAEEGGSFVASVRRSIYLELTCKNTWSVSLCFREPEEYSLYDWRNVVVEQPASADSTPTIRPNVLKSPDAEPAGQPTSTAARSPSHPPPPPPLSAPGSRFTIARATGGALLKFLPQNYSLSSHFCFKYHSSGVFQGPRAPHGKHYFNELKRCVLRYTERRLSASSAENDDGSTVVPERVARFRISTANKDFALCETMPELTVVPHDTTDAEIEGLADFRVGRRFPMVSWIHPISGATLLRASQPAVGVRNRRSSVDEAYMTTLCVTENTPVAVLDARPFQNAVANLAKGGGYISVANYTSSGCKAVYADIGNIHAMRAGLDKLRKSLATGQRGEPEWRRALETSGWISHIRKILSASVKVATMVGRESTSVLVHCTNGWDRTSQIVSIANLLLDPYYRTIRGFIVLIEKDWFAGAHKFAERLGLAGSEKHRAKGLSPIYLQFIEAVAHVVKQFPQAFEFNTAFLLWLCYVPWEGKIGSFCCNSPKVCIFFQTFQKLFSSGTQRTL